MGLDMYLTAREKSTKTEEIEVAYWRKANSIHRWFVENVQDGEDDCSVYRVSKDQLLELYATVTFLLSQLKLKEGVVNNGQRYKDGEWVPILESGKVIENADLAEELLPTTEGFFFGSTDYNQYYYEDLLNTKKQLEKLFEDFADVEYFNYQSSW